MIWGESPLFSETSTLVSGKLRCFFSLSVSIHLTTGRKKKSRLRQGGRLSRGTTKPGSSGSSLPSKRLTYPTLGSLENHRLKHAILGGYVSFLEGMFSRIKPPHMFGSPVPFMSRIYCCVFSSNKNHRSPERSILRHFSCVRLIFLSGGSLCNPCVPLYVSKDGASIV